MPAFVHGEWQDGEIRGVNFLAGIRGMGKTTEMGRLMRGTSGRVVFYDHTGEHPSLLSGGTTIRQPGELKDALLSGRKRVRYVPPEEASDFGGKDSKGEPENVTHFRAVCAICSVFGRLILAIDEMDFYCGAEWGARGMPRELYSLVHFGRHPKISMVFTARDPTTISIKARSQCETVRIFRTVEDSYVKYFRGRIGDQMASMLPALPPYRYVMHGAGEGVRGVFSAGKRIS